MYKLNLYYCWGINQTGSMMDRIMLNSKGNATQAEIASMLRQDMER